jgi:hypothetical protein
VEEGIELFPMRVVIPVHQSNLRSSLRLAHRIKETGGTENHRLVISSDSINAAQSLKDALTGCFKDITLCVSSPLDPHWPRKENELFKHCADHFWMHYKEPWLRLETESVPLAITWLDEIEMAFQNIPRTKKILAARLADDRRFPGTAVFPADLITCSLLAFAPSSTWYSDGQRELTAHTEFTDLIVEVPTPNTVLQINAVGAATGKIDRPCFIQLGRLGDVLNILPLICHVSTLGKKPVLMVHQEFSSVTEGLPYCDVEVITEGSWTELDNATEIAREKYSEVHVCQIHGTHQSARKTPSFAIDAWARAGYWGEFGLHPLMLARSPEREARLLASVNPQQPFILVSRNGTSSPFAHGDELLSLARAHCPNVIDLSSIRAENFVDLLALYERADMLITTDTATIHLAEASSVPVVALLADSPTRWHGSPPKGNVVLAIRYSEFSTRRGEIDAAIQRNRISSSSRSIFHVYQDYAGSEEEQRRNALALRTWKREDKGWFDIPAGGFTRDATSVGDTRKLPFIKDVIERGYQESKDFSEIPFILLTNTDTCLTPGFKHTIQRLNGEAYFSHRRDFARLDRPLTQNEIENGQWYPGSDLFVFTPQWWEAHRDEMPDMILGAEGWDKILRELVKATGGGEIHGCCYHERHESGWERAGARENAPSNVYCRFLAKKFLTEHNLPLEEMEHLPSDWEPVKIHVGTAADKRGAMLERLAKARSLRGKSMKKKKQHA